MGGKILKLQSEKLFENGERTQAIETAKMMLLDHEPMEKICRYTKLSEEDILKIESGLNTQMYG